MSAKKIRWKHVSYHWEIYLFIVPALVLIVLFQYYPAASGIFHSFYRWNGADISEFVGLRNYIELLKSPDFWQSFRAAFLLGLWNVVKMIPAIAVAVWIHRCSSERMQYLYRLLFVIPMVIPALVIALIWRSFFFEATQGYLNQFLEASGLFALAVQARRIFRLGRHFYRGHPAGLVGRSSVDPGFLRDLGISVGGFVRDPDPSRQAAEYPEGDLRSRKHRRRNLVDKVHPH